MAYRWLSVHPLITELHVVDFFSSRFCSRTRVFVSSLFAKKPNLDDERVSLGPNIGLSHDLERGSHRRVEPAVSLGVQEHALTPWTLAHGACTASLWTVVSEVCPASAVRSDVGTDTRTCPLACRGCHTVWLLPSSRLFSPPLRCKLIAHAVLVSRRRRAHLVHRRLSVARPFVACRRAGRYLLTFSHLDPSRSPSAPLLSELPTPRHTPHPHSCELCLCILLHDDIAAALLPVAGASTTHQRPPRCTPPRARLRSRVVYAEARKNSSSS